MTEIQAGRHLPPTEQDLHLPTPGRQHIFERSPRKTKKTTRNNLSQWSRKSFKIPSSTSSHSSSSSFLPLPSYSAFLYFSLFAFLRFFCAPFLNQTASASASSSSSPLSITVSASLASCNNLFFPNQPVEQTSRTLGNCQRQQQQQQQQPQDELINFKSRACGSWRQQ